MRFFVALSLVLLTGSMGCSGALTEARTESAVGAAQGAAPLDLSLDGSPSYGPRDAKVTLVVSQGFQCLWSAEYGRILEALYDRYPESVRVVFKHLSYRWHKRAIPAAQGAMAAHLQGKFWPYYDRLFAKSISELSDADLERYADEVGLDVARWRIDKESEAVKAKLEHDVASLVGLRASRTPTSFINGKMVKGERSLANLLKAFDAAIAEADAELERGTPMARLHATLATKHGGPGFVSSVIEGGTPLPPPPSKRKLAPVALETFNAGLHPDDATMGPDDAPVALMVFSDFECSFCGALKPTLATLMEAYPKRLKIVFKHKPLKRHDSARSAAMASLAAHAQGKFWAYHDLLFENSEQLEAADLRGYAEQLGLDMSAFDDFVSSATGGGQIVRDLSLAKEFGVTGVPAIFVNGKPMIGPRSPENLMKLIDAALEALEP